MHPFTPPSDQLSEQMRYIEEDLLLSSESEPYLPPPHIAARISRAKVRSSAASSRRNSITSSRSTRSGHGPPQSSHVAQHLRRADLLEKRKAKAAIRNAHAEEVRSRAAILREAPRNAITSREDRALAAQQAREKYLAQVKANCAEEVQRSKRVAAQQREKRARENIKLKEDMDARHTEAEKRKNLLQQHRRPRTATVSDKKPKYVWKPTSPAQAAIIIQKAWRKRQWTRIVEEFLGLGLTLDAVSKGSLEEVGELLNEERLLDCTSRMLPYLGLENDKGRTFLSIFLILGNPAQLFSQRGDQEQDLANKARELWTEFNCMLIAPYPTPLVSLFSQYEVAFASWRQHDSSRLVSAMVAQFVELDAIWQSVKEDTDGGVAEDYKVGIQDNQSVILAKLKKFVGPERAMKLIRDAVRASRKANAKKKQEAKASRKPRVVVDPQPDKPRVASNVDPLPAANAAEAGNPTRRQLESSSLVPENRIIMHELAINKDWKIDAEPKDSVRDETLSAISRDLQRGLDAGLGDIWVPAMAEIIRDRLLSLLKPGNSLHTMISEALDTELIAREVKLGNFAYEKFFAFLNTVLPQLCAPVRDNMVKALSTDPSDDPVNQLARIFYVVDIIRLDMLNFTLQRLVPTLLEQASGYETRRFAADLNGRFPDRTLQWWQGSKANQEGDVSSNKIYMTGLVDLATGTAPLEKGDLPETMLLDLDRLNRLRRDNFRVILIGSILSIAKNLLRRDVRTLWKAEAQRMFDLPFTSPPAAFVSIIESRYALPAMTKTQLTTGINRLLLDAREGQANHPVLKVLSKKVKTHVLMRLSASSAEERTRLSAVATETLATGGLPEFVGRIHEMIAELERVAQLDRESHGQWYEMVTARLKVEEAKVGSV